MKIWSFLSGFITGSVILSVCMGSVPKPSTVQPDSFKPGAPLGQVTDDSALYQNLSEIRVAPEKSMDFDQDLHRLSKMEGRYRERVRPLNPRERMSAPIQRVTQTKYKPAAAVAPVRRAEPRSQVVPQHRPAPVAARTTTTTVRKVTKTVRRTYSRPRIGVPMNAH